MHGVKSIHLVDPASPAQPHRANLMKQDGARCEVREERQEETQQEVYESLLESVGPSKTWGLSESDGDRSSPP